MSVTDANAEQQEIPGSSKTENQRPNVQPRRRHPRACARASSSHGPPPREVRQPPIVYSVRLIEGMRVGIERMGGLKVGGWWSSGVEGQLERVEPARGSAGDGCACFVSFIASRILHHHLAAAYQSPGVVWYSTWITVTFG